TVTGNGVENLSIDNTNNGNNPGIILFGCYQCWVKGVRSLYAGRNHVWLYRCVHCVVRDSYFYQSTTHASVSYGIEIDDASSDDLVENNIFDRVTDSTPNNNGGGTGNVAGYNYTVATDYTASN